jgi:hypothetical protein
MFGIFKTNVDSAGQAEDLLEILCEFLPSAEINFDLDDCDRILRINGGDFSPLLIIRILEEQGFDCQVIL